MHICIYIYIQIYVRECVYTYIYIYKEISLHLGVISLHLVVVIAIGSKLKPSFHLQPAEKTADKNVPKRE